MDLFQNPFYLLAAALWVAGAWALKAYADRRRFRLLSLLGRPATLLRLIPAETDGRRRVQWALQTAGIAFLFIALAGPQWGVELVTTRSQELQVLLAVDTSLSMLAEDAKPSRIEKAKREMAEMIEGLKGERVGILTFAGAAHVQCPLTTDSEAARSFLGSIRVGMVPQAGTAIADTLELGTKILSKYPGHKAIVLLTDGEDRRRDPMEPAREATQAGVHLYIVGVGSPEGEPIPLKDDQGKTTGYLKDRGGKTVVSKLQEEASIRLAAAAQGAYYRATPEEAEAREVLRHIRALERSSARAGSTRRYKNRYAVALLLGFLLLLLEMFVPERGDWRPPLLRRPRRPSDRAATAPLALVLGALLLCGCDRSRSVRDLWRGNRAYHKETFDQALARYREALREAPKDPRPVFNSGAAQYKLGNLDEAQQSFSSLAAPPKLPATLRSKAFYNLGNTHYRKSELKEAAEAYRQCLLLDPSDEDCRHNLVKTLQQLKNPQSQKDKKDPQKKSGGQDQKQPPQDQNPQKSGPKPDRPRPQSGLSQEDAQRILQAVQERQKEVPRPQPSWQKQPDRPPEEVDW